MTEVARKRPSHPLQESSTAADASDGTISVWVAEEARLGEAMGAGSSAALRAEGLVFFGAPAPRDSFATKVAQESKVVFEHNSRPQVNVRQGHPGVAPGAVGRSQQPWKTIPDGGGWKAHGRQMGSTAARKQLKVGYDYVHSLVDDHSRLAYSEILSDEKGPPVPRSSNAPSPTSLPTASPASSG